MRHFSLRGETPLVWSHSEVVITLPCHGSITGSNPVETVAIPRMTIEIQVVKFVRINRTSILVFLNLNTLVIGENWNQVNGMTSCRYVCYNIFKHRSSSG